MKQFEELFNYLSDAEGRILAVMKSSDATAHYRPDDIADSVLSYPCRPAKRLRPSVLLMAAGALGGAQREPLALPAAAGVELFHTWTLVHDDLIDNDALRRGGPTVHEAMAGVGRSRYGLENHLAAEYGRDIAVLTGDIQHGWSIASFVDCALQGEVNSTLILKLIKHLQSYVLGNLIYGQVLDIQYSIHDLTDPQVLDEAKIVEMLWLKTGVLYEFAAMAGALIGKNTEDFEDEEVQKLTRFASKCGTAFQLQDDILGILGDQASLGKPVGSDIREGKMTVIVYESLINANEPQREIILSTLGNRSAGPDQIKAITQLFVDLNGIGRTRDLAARYIEEALPLLDTVPDSRYKRLLQLWAHYMLQREL